MNISALDLPFIGRRAFTSNDRLVSTVAFDAIVTALASWFLAGLYLDGWAHLHLPSALETFFTPWHGVLYSGFFAAAAFLIATYVRNVTRGSALTRALPVGYGLSLIGAMIFFIGGVGDMTWHLLFGIEANVEALLSPTHLVLALGGSLVATGPLRAALARKESASNAPALLPAILSALIFLSILTFFTEYASPFGETIAGFNHRPTTTSETFHFEALGIAAVLLQSALLSGIVLYLVRRWSLPFGSLTLLITLNTLLMVLMNDRNLATGTYPMIAVGFLAGLAGDGLNRWWRPSVARVLQFRLFAFTLPMLLYALYFGTLILFGGGIWWTVHLWAGAIVLAGIVGWLMSCAFVPFVGEAKAS